MRVLLFTGKGGTGKTTLAAATAVHAARCGLKTLTVSLDRAPSLADCLGHRLDGDPVELESGLSAVQVDARRRGERSWRVSREYVFGLLDAVGVDPVAAEELTVLPGVDETLALFEVRDLIAEAAHDLVVLDAPETSETLRLLALPEALGRYLDAALPVERRVRRAMATGAQAASHGRRSVRPPVPRDYLVEAADRLIRELAGVQKVLTSPVVSVRLVVTPESTGLARARRSVTELALYGCPVDLVIANRVIPRGGRAGWQDGWARAHAHRLGQAERCLHPLPLLRLAEAEAEPLGRTALAKLGESLYGVPGQAAAQALVGFGPVEAGPRVERDGAEFLWRLPLPLARREELELSRLGDELSLTVAGRRRLLALPSALRRCLVVGATLRDGVLQVRFRPNPALWRTP